MFIRLPFRGEAGARSRSRARLTPRRPPPTIGLAGGTHRHHHEVGQDEARGAGGRARPCRGRSTTDCGPAADRRAAAAVSASLLGHRGLLAAEQRRRGRGHGPGAGAGRLPPPIGHRTAATAEGAAGADEPPPRSRTAVAVAVTAAVVTVATVVLAVIGCGPDGATLSPMPVSWRRSRPGSLRGPVGSIGGRAHQHHGRRELAVARRASRRPARSGRSATRLRRRARRARTPTSQS